MNTPSQSGAEARAASRRSLIKAEVQTLARSPGCQLSHNIQQVNTLMNIPPVLIEIRLSQMLEGQVGLFAVHTMKSGLELVSASSFQETFEPWSTYEAMDSETRRKVDAFCVSTPTGIWMPKDFNLLPVCYFMNHSCSPNVAINKDGSFVVFRDVKAGDELCWDFATGFSSPRFRLECRCGTTACRGIVTGNDWERPELQAQYDGFFLSYLQEKINALRGRG